MTSLTSIFRSGPLELKTQTPLVLGLGITPSPWLPGRLFLRSLAGLAIPYGTVLLYKCILNIRCFFQHTPPAACLLNMQAAVHSLLKLKWKWTNMCLFICKQQPLWEASYHVGHSGFHQLTDVWCLWKAWALSWSPTLNTAHGVKGTIFGTLVQTLAPDISLST